MNQELRNLLDGQKLLSEQLKEFEERINEGKKISFKEMEDLRVNICRNMKPSDTTNKYFSNHIEELFSFLNEIANLIDTERKHLSEEKKEEQEEQKNQESQELKKLITQIRELIRYRISQYQMFISTYHSFKQLEIKNNEL